MARDGSFSVEDFLGAITSQLDRTQDALRIKAVNRPLTYAIKDFDMELKVFVEMDGEGKVRFRPPAANEAGASSIKIGFTTITRPMIQENTVELALTRSPTLQEAGMPQAERDRLERLGVRTTGELQRLRQSTGTEGISRVSDVPVDRLRAALSFGRPQVGGVRPVPAPAAPPPPPATPPAPPPSPAAPPRPARDRTAAPAVRRPGPAAQGLRPTGHQAPRADRAQHARRRPPAPGRRAAVGGGGRRRPPGGRPARRRARERNARGRARRRR